MSTSVWTYCRWQAEHWKWELKFKKQITPLLLLTLHPFNQPHHEWKRWDKNKSWTRQKAVISTISCSVFNVAFCLGNLGTLTLYSACVQYAIWKPLTSLFKVAHNSFQHIPRLRFWCVIITTLYHLKLQSWYQKTAQSLINMLVLFSWHIRLP